MKKKINLKVFIIIILTILVFMYLIIFNIKKNTKVEIEAEIARLGTNYVIAIDEDNNEYLLNTNEQYNIGDKISVILKNVKKGNQTTGEIIKIDIISRNINFSITDEQKKIKETEESLTNNSEKANKTETNSNQETNHIINELQSSNNTINSNNDIINITTEEQVIAYFADLEKEIDSTNSFKESLKEKFIIIIDFLFYDGKIGEKNFKDLTNSTKLKVLEITLSIDQKIETKFPGYKETISTNSKNIYTNLKVKVIELYLETTTSICKENQDLCNEAKIGLGDLKKNFSLTWDFIKEISGVGLEKLRSWYEIWKTI